MSTDQINQIITDDAVEIIKSRSAGRKYIKDSTLINMLSKNHGIDKQKIESILNGENEYVLCPTCDDHPMYGDEVRKVHWAGIDDETYISCQRCGYLFGIYPKLKQLKKWVAASKRRFISQMTKQAEIQLG